MLHAWLAYDRLALYKPSASFFVQYTLLVIIRLKYIFFYFSRKKLKNKPQIKSFNLKSFYRAKFKIHNHILICFDFDYKKALNEPNLFPFISELALGTLCAYFAVLEKYIR